MTNWFGLLCCGFGPSCVFRNTYYPIQFDYTLRQAGAWVMRLTRLLFAFDIYQTHWQGGGRAQSNGTHISQGGRRGSTGTPISGWVSGKLFGLCGAFIVHLFASQYASSPFAVGDKRAAMGKRQPATVNWKEPTAVLLNSYKGFAFASSKQAKRKKAIKII